VPKKKSRLNVSLDDLEREKLEKLAEEAGLSLSRTIAQLIRKAKVNKMTGDAVTRGRGDAREEDAGEEDGVRRGKKTR
jgi:macrodomain Ter protein organizer (MatP/YcbG family)